MKDKFCMMIKKLFFKSNEVLCMYKYTYIVQLHIIYIVFSRRVDSELRKR